MTRREEKLAAGRTGYSTLRASSRLAQSEITVVTSCEECDDFGETTTGAGALHTGYRAAPPQVVLHALRLVRKHVALTGHAAHAHLVEVRTYAPRVSRVA